MHKNSASDQARSILTQMRGFGDCTTWHHTHTHSGALDLPACLNPVLMLTLRRDMMRCDGCDHVKAAPCERGKGDIGVAGGRTLPLLLLLLLLLLVPRGDVIWPYQCPPYSIAIPAACPLWMWGPPCSQPSLPLALGRCTDQQHLRTVGAVLSCDRRSGLVARP